MNIVHVSCVIKIALHVIMVMLKYCWWTQLWYDIYIAKL